MTERSLTHLEEPQQRRILEVDSDGLFLALDDGSGWNIPAGDNTKALAWQAGMRVIVESAGACAFPFRITNVDTPRLEVVRAAKGS